MARFTTALLTCDTCERPTLGDADGTASAHHDIRDWPRDRGIGSAPMCAGTTGRVREVRTTDMDDITWHYVRHPDSL